MYKIQDAEIELLRKVGVSEDDIAHCVKVAQKALDIAHRTKAVVDLELIGRGALFHDLGKAKTHGMHHGMIGAEIGKSLGLPDDITAIMEKHIRGGLTVEEAKELDLPVKDYTLTKLEERIVIYADRLVDIITDGIVMISSEQEAEDRFEEILKAETKYGKNAMTLERYLGYHREIQGLIKRNMGQVLQTVKPEELENLMNSNKDVILLDVRRNVDYDADKSMIQGAQKLDPEKVDDWVNSNDKSKEVALYCVRGGSVSKAVTEKLISAGVKAKYLEGGYEAWKQIKASS